MGLLAGAALGGAPSVAIMHTPINMTNITPSRLLPPPTLLMIWRCGIVTG